VVIDPPDEGKKNYARQRGEERRREMSAKSAGDQDRGECRRDEPYTSPSRDRANVRASLARVIEQGHPPRIPDESADDGPRKRECCGSYEEKEDLLAHDVRELMLRSGHVRGGEPPAGGLS
jgi:hypothetical protein